MYRSILWALLFTVVAAAGWAQNRFVPQWSGSGFLKPEFSEYGTVAILPFENLTTEPGLAEETRRAFYNHFSSKPYTDIEMSAVDEKLLVQARPGPAGNAALDIAALCRELGCDGVVTGRVTDFRKLYAGVYSELAIAAEVRLIDARTGETLIEHGDRVAYREGGLSLSPIGLVMTAISTALNLRDIQRVRLISELGHKVAIKTIVVDQLPAALGNLELPTSSKLLKSRHRPLRQYPLYFSRGGELVDQVLVPVFAFLKLIGELKWDKSVI